MNLHQKLRRARARYTADPTSRRLRWLLTLKGRAGVFDARMCGFYGVDPRVNAPCRRFIARGYAAGLVPTSTTGGRHAPGSFHGRRNRRGEGKAVDLGLRGDLVGTARGQARMAAFQRREHARWARGRAPALRELIGPVNDLVVLRGGRAPLPEGAPLEQAHDDHVHGAFEG